MIDIFSILFKQLRKCNYSTFNVLITGPASSGKTAFTLRQLKGRYIDPTTIGDVGTILLRRSNCFLNIIDMDTCSLANRSINPQSIYEHSYDTSKNKYSSLGNRTKNSESSILFSGDKNNRLDGILFFVDSSDHGRIPLAKKLLVQLISEKIGYKLPILIIATKQDVPGALKPCELRKRLNIDELMDQLCDQIQEYSVVGVSSYTGSGCNEALEWISEAIWRQKKSCYCIPFNSICYCLYN
ncbi:ADP-ribosylation factor-like protein 2 [Cryptosporidium felis]|nr:ADP-ribosylation factor-like protein 2 [Cryptosporidium felis]